MLESLFKKVPGFHTCNVIEKRLQHRCFPCKIFKNTYFKEHLRMARFVSVPWYSYIDSFLGSIAHVLIFKLVSSFLQMLLTHFMPLISFDTPRKPEVFLCFQGASKEISGLKWGNTLLV